MMIIVIGSKEERSITPYDNNNLNTVSSTLSIEEIVAWQWEFYKKRNGLW